MIMIFFSVRIPGTITALKGPSFKGGLLPIGKTEDRDSIRSKVFGGEGEGFGEGKRGLSPESPLFPPPNLPLSPSKTFNWWGGCTRGVRSTPVL